MCVGDILAGRGEVVVVRDQFRMMEERNEHLVEECLKGQYRVRPQSESGLHSLSRRAVTARHNEGADARSDLEDTSRARIAGQTECSAAHCRQHLTFTSMLPTFVDPPIRIQG